MDKIFLVLALLFRFSASGWQYDLQEAEKMALKEHKLVLLNFSGSDWCGPCIQMHKEIFGSRTFLQFADSTLVLVNADFPRMKKNQLSPGQQAKNNGMADHYNPEGKFPYTVLLDANGKILRDWDGYYHERPEIFVDEIQSFLHASR